MSRPHPFQEALDIKRKKLAAVMLCADVLKEYDYEVPLALDVLATHLMEEIRDLTRRPQVIASNAAKRLLQ